MKAPKILAVVSATDMAIPYGGTPANWQLWKGMYEAGVDLILTPYRGRAIESPWWRTYANTCYWEGQLFAAARTAAARVQGPRHVRRAEDGTPRRGVGDEAMRRLIWHRITPRWQRHLERILERERSIEAVIFFTVPSSHFRGIPTALRERFGVPVAYYDGDIPMSLPEWGSMDTGFSTAHGGDPGEYDLVLSNSEGGLARLLELGARRAETLFWGADPGLFAPLSVEKEWDVFFYGIGDKFRRDWMRELIGEPSRQAPDIDFVVGGSDFLGDLGDARTIGDVPTNFLSHTISASRVNLNITRRPHATVPRSSTCRIFELAAAGATIVSNPHEGIERWFEPGRELLLVASTAEAIAAYRGLLADPAEAEELGRRARQRVLEEHTYSQRARELLQHLGVSAPRARPGRRNLT